MMTFDEIMALEFPSGSHIDKANTSVSCDGSSKGGKDRAKGDWKGTLRCVLDGRTVQDIVNAAVSQYTIKWAATARKDIPSFRSKDMVEYHVPDPQDRRAVVPITDAQVLAAYTVEQLEALIAAKQ